MRGTRDGIGWKKDGVG